MNQTSNPQPILVGPPNEGEQKPKAGHRIIPLSHWERYHEWPTTGGLRHLVFHKDKFGFGVCIRRVGRKVLISEKDFFEWLEKDGGNLAKRGK